MRCLSGYQPVLAGLLLLALLPAVSATAQNVETPPENDAAVATAPDTVAVENIADDSKIVQRLQKIYESSGWFEDIEVTSNSGFVRLSGLADTDEHSGWAKDVATRTTDVIGVSNELRVESRLDFAGAMDVVGRSLNTLYRNLLLRFPFIVAGIIVIFFTWLISKLVQFILNRVLSNRKRIRKSLQDLLMQLSSIAIWLIGFLIATVIVFPGMTPARALTVLGLGSVAIGFAFKDIFENFFAGVLILWRYPFDIGDFIEIDDVSGKVVEITIRNTLIRRTDGELVIVPNGQLFKSSVEVLTSRNLRRERIICGVGYAEDIAESRRVIRQAVESCPSVDDHKEVQIFAHEFGESSINFEVAWWTGATPLAIRESRDEVITAIKSALDQANIEIPFPYRTLTFADAVRVESGTTAGSSTGS